MKRTFLIFLSSLAAVSSLIEREWVSAEVGDPAGLETTSVRKEVYFTSSLRHCMGLATRHDWAYLACYLPSEGCSLFETNAIVDGDVNKDETLGPTECKVRRDLAVCLGNGAVGFSGDKRDGECPDQFTCTVNGWEDTSSVSPATTCDSSNGFSMIAGMCLLIVEQKDIYCTARTNCQSLGAEIASFETAELFENFRQYLLASSISESLFVGVKQDASGNWLWMFNNRSPGPASNTGDWADNPIKSEDDCGRMLPSQDFKLDTQDCSALYFSVCRIYL